MKVKESKSGYSGNILVTSPGFKFPTVMFVSKFLLPLFAGVGWMITKVSLKRGKVVFVSTNFKKGTDILSNKLKKFLQKK